MIKIEPCRKLLIFFPAVYVLAVFAVFWTALSVVIKILLLMALSFYTVSEALKTLGITSSSLQSFTLTDDKNCIEIVFGNNEQTQAKLLSSTCVTAWLVFLHLRPINRKMTTCHLIIPSMIGLKNFHALLIYLKTN